MKYLVLAALLTGSSVVPDKILDWVTDSSAVQQNLDVIYNRDLDLQGPNFILEYNYRGSKRKMNISGTYNVRYVDKGKLGRSVEDIISFENKEIMFWDQGLDGVLDGGHVKGVFFSRKLPKGLLEPMQDVYVKVINKSARRLKDDQRPSSPSSVTED
jgi:hypothetical protein